MLTNHQFGTGLTRTEPMSAGKYQPYRRFCVQQGEHREAGPSTLAPPPIPYVGLPALQPSGGVISEPVADAESTQITVEEDRVPVSNFYCSHIPRAIEWSSGVRQSPSGPSALGAKDLLAPTARGCRRTLSSCSTGRSADWGSGNLQPTMWL